MLVIVLNGIFECFLTVILLYDVAYRLYFHLVYVLFRPEPFQHFLPQRLNLAHIFQISQRIQLSVAFTHSELRPQSVIGGQRLRYVSEKQMIVIGLFLDRLRECQRQLVRLASAGRHALNVDGLIVEVVFPRFPP